MGSKIEGIFSHPFNSFEQIETLPQRLQVTLPALANLSYWAVSGNSQSNHPSWTLALWGRPRSDLTPKQQFESGSGPMLFAPAKSVVDSISSIVFGRRCLFVTTGVKWWAAMLKISYVHEVRDYFRALASVLGSSGFILHRENGALSWSWVERGLTIDQIELEFKRLGANRATTIEELPATGPAINDTSYYREDSLA